MIQMKFANLTTENYGRKYYHTGHDKSGIRNARDNQKAAHFHTDLYVTIFFPFYNTSRGNHLLGQANKYGFIVSPRATTFKTDLSCPGNAQFSHLLFCIGQWIKITHKTSVPN